MSKKETRKYYLPVEVAKHKPISWLNLTYYDYKIYADENEEKFTSIKLTDIDGFIIGKHMPTKLHTIYDKVAIQAKAGTVKAVSEIKNVVDKVADIGVAAAQEVKGDVSKTASVAAGIFGKLRTFTKDRFIKQPDVNKEDPPTSN